MSEDGGGEGGGEKKRMPENPVILENAPWYFTIWFICKLTVCQPIAGPTVTWITDRVDSRKIWEEIWV